MLAQALGGFANLALAGEKNQDIARPVPPQFIHRIKNRLLQVAIALVLVIGQQRPVAQFHRITAPGDLDDRRSVKWRAKRSGSMVAEVMMIFSSGRRARRRLR